MSTVTVALLKTNLYLNIDNTTYDIALAQLIEDINAQIIDYLDDSDITAASDFDTVLERKSAVQMTHEFQRRKDTGLVSVTFPDGSVNKFEVNEWLPSVKRALDRHRNFGFGTSDYEDGT